MTNRHSQSNDARNVTREELVALLNEDLAGEYQAIISYVIYSQVLKGAQYMNIAAELETHAAEELAHALTIAGQIDYLGGMPLAVPKPVKTSTAGRRHVAFRFGERERNDPSLSAARMPMRSLGRICRCRTHSRHPGAGTGSPGCAGECLGTGSSQRHQT